MRAVLDPNVLIAALLSGTGPPARLLVRWLAGDLELLVSPRLLAELPRALAYPKLRARISADAAAAFVDLLARTASRAADPEHVPRRSRDPGDDHLIALAEQSAAVLVTGDDDLLVLRDIPVRSPAAFLAELAGRP